MKPPDQQTARRLQEGFDALNRGQLDIAANACQQVLAEHPDMAAAHFLVGLVAVEGDERRVAHRAFKSVLKLDANHAAAWAQLARLNASEGRIALAEDALKEVRRIKPTDPAVLDLTGTVLNQLGEYETAKAFFAAVNRAAPGQATHHYRYQGGNELGLTWAQSSDAGPAPAFFCRIKLGSCGSKLTSSCAYRLKGHQAQSAEPATQA